MTSRIFHCSIGGQPLGVECSHTVAGKSWQPCHKTPYGKGGMKGSYHTAGISGGKGRQGRQSTKTSVLEIDFSTPWKMLFACYPLQTPKKHGIQMHATLLYACTSQLHAPHLLTLK